MFSFFDFLFREERTKNATAREFGMTESHHLQRGVMKDEMNQNDINQYDTDEINAAIVHTRQDIVLLVAILQRTNILLRWIRLLLICLLILLLYKFKVFTFWL
jgi:hypothetical protein